MEEHVSLEENGKVLHITLNRPDVRNAFDARTIKDLTKAFKVASKNKKIRVIYLSGEGPSFCAGGDLKWMKSMVKYTKAANQKDANLLYDMFQAAVDCPLPIVGYVHGHVFGGGTGLAAVCDIVAADRSTEFCFSEVRLGIAPAVISSFVLAKMEPHKAREYMLTGRIFNAEEAYRHGLVHFAGRELEAKKYIDKTIDALLKVGPEAVRETKKMLKEMQRMESGKIKTYSARLIATRRVSKEGQEGMKAFLNKRKPNWYGTHEPKD